MKNNILFIHGGGPTSVLNASLYGALSEALSHQHVGNIFGARAGSGGVIKGDFIDLRGAFGDKLPLLPFTPGSIIGTSRDILKDNDYKLMANVIKSRNIRIVLYTGGNGSMEACGRLADACGNDVFIVGIPKTIDNNISVTDHTPGFGSAARYLIATVREISEDVRSLAFHVSIIETMGHNTGWLPAASALSWRFGNGPHMILPPEIPFEEDRFLIRVQELYKEYGGVVIVTNNALRNRDGSLIVEPLFQKEHDIYYGDVGPYLSGLIIKKLGIKARNEKPGIAGRSSVAWQSSVDRNEAILAGREAFRAAIQEKSRVMVGFERLTTVEYLIKPILIPIENVMTRERTIPYNYLISDKWNIREEYLNWLAPLIGEPLPQYCACM